MSYSSIGLLDDTRLDLKSWLVINGFGANAIPDAKKRLEARNSGRDTFKLRLPEDNAGVSPRNKPLKAIHTMDLQLDSDQTSIWDSDSQGYGYRLSRWKSDPNCSNLGFHSNSFGNNGTSVLDEGDSGILDEIVDEAMNFNCNNDQETGSEHETKPDKFNSHLEQLLDADLKRTTTNGNSFSSRSSDIPSVSQPKVDNSTERRKSRHSDRPERERRRRKSSKRIPSDTDSKSTAQRSSSPSILSTECSTSTVDSIDNLSEISPTVIDYHSENPSISISQTMSEHLPMASQPFSCILPIGQTQFTTNCSRNGVSQFCIMYPNGQTIPCTIPMLPVQNTDQISEQSSQQVDETGIHSLDLSETIPQDVLKSEQYLSGVYKDKFTGRLHYFLKLQTLENEVKEKDQTLKQLTAALKSKERAQEVRIRYYQSLSEN